MHILKMNAGFPGRVHVTISTLELIHVGALMPPIDAFAIKGRQQWDSATNDASGFALGLD